MDKTSIKVYDSVSFATASRAARNELARALKGGDAVDRYFRLLMLGGELLRELQNVKGFHRNANDGLYKDQQSYFYGRGNSDMLTAFGTEDGYGEFLYEQTRYSAFLAFDNGRDVGSVVHFALGIAGKHSAFKWGDLSDIVLPALGQSMNMAFHSVLTYLKSAPKLEAKKVLERAAGGAEIGFENEGEKVSPKGNKVHFHMEADKKESLSGLEQIAGALAINAGQYLTTEGISQAVVVQNFTDRKFRLEVSHLGGNTELAIFPGGKSKSIEIHGAIPEGKEVGVGEAIADRPLAGEANLLFRSPTADGEVSYTLEFHDTTESNKAALVFNGPAIGENSAGLVFNPAGSGSEIHTNHARQSGELVLSNSLNDLAITVAFNNHSEETISLKTGKPGYFYRAIVVIHYKTDQPDSWGRSPLDGLLFGDNY